MDQNERSTAVANPITGFSGFLDKFKPQLALALPKHMTADRMARLALTAFSTSPKLQLCTPHSIAASIMTAGQLGLEPGVNGAGFLIPYKTTCTFVPGWKGLVDLMNRSGRGTVYTGVIFKDQRYNFTDGAKRDLIILNETELDAPEDFTHAYAIGWVKDAAMPIIELWTVPKITKHRDKYNKVGDKHYSYRDWEMYCRKVPLLQVLKYMPQSVELSNAIAVNDKQEGGHGVTIENGIVIETGEILGDGDDRASANATQTAKTYDADQFAKNLPGWTAMIQSGKKTAAQVIAMVSSKAPLTGEQRAAIEAVKKAEKSDPPTPTLEKIIASLKSAKDMAVLDVAADLITALPENEQTEANAVYNECKALLKGGK